MNKHFTLISSMSPQLLPALKKSKSAPHLNINICQCIYKLNVLSDYKMDILPYFIVHLCISCMGRSAPFECLKTFVIIPSLLNKIKVFIKYHSKASWFKSKLQIDFFLNHWKFCLHFGVSYTSVLDNSWNVLIYNDCSKREVKVNLNLSEICLSHVEHVCFNFFFHSSFLQINHRNQTFKEI